MVHTFHGLAAAFSLIFYTFFLLIYYKCTFCACSVIQLFLTKIYKFHNKGSQNKRNQIPPPLFKNKIKCVLVNILNCSVKWFNTPFEVLKSFFSISVRYHNEILTGRNTRYEQATNNMSGLKNEIQADAYSNDYIYCIIYINRKVMHALMHNICLLWYILSSENRTAWCLWGKNWKSANSNNGVNIDSNF